VTDVLGDGSERG
jgi:hypothetical protein